MPPVFNLKAFIWQVFTCGSCFLYVHLEDKISEDLHVAEKASIVWVCVTLCLISPHIQIINMVMTLQLVVFLFTLVYTCVGCVSVV